MWLQVAAQVPSVYVPQMADDVVYLRVGHARFLESRNDKRQPPWESPTLAVRIYTCRAVRDSLLRIKPLHLKSPVASYAATSQVIGCR